LGNIGKLKLIALTALVLSLAACATSTPLEQCVSSAQQEYRGMLALRAETAANVSRGYAIHSQRVPYQYTGLCYVPYEGNYSCQKTGRRDQETPVAIDVRQETQKLRDIDRSLSRLEQEAGVGVQQCRATYSPA
jgi:hypothetical protein